MAIEVVIARAHTAQLDNPDVRKEFESVRECINNLKIDYVDNTVNFVFIKGLYNHSERKMITACLFVNKMNNPLKEIHGELRLKFKEKNALIAKTIVNFDEPFIGVLEPNQALLVHMGIPVKGLETDEEITFKDIKGSFDGVRVTMS